jgi:hypothetical protein
MKTGASRHRRVVSRAPRHRRVNNRLDQHDMLIGARPAAREGMVAENTAAIELPAVNGSTLGVPTGQATGLLGPRRPCPGE